MTNTAEFKNSSVCASSYPINATIAKKWESVHVTDGCGPSKPYIRKEWSKKIDIDPAPIFFEYDVFVCIII